MAQSIAALLDQLRRQARDRLTWPSPDAAFARAILSWEGGTGFIQQSADSTSVTQGQSSPLATAGYGLWAKADQIVSPQDWQAGLARLAQRDAFAADRQTFAFRPYALTGIALGAAAVQANTDWMARVLGRLASDSSLSTRQRLLLAFVCAQTGLAQPLAVPIDVPAGDLGEVALALCLRTFHEHIVRLDGVASSDAAGHILFKRAITEPLEDFGGVESVAASLLISRLANAYLDLKLEDAGALGVITGAAISEVIALCRRFDLAVRHLAVRHAGRSGIAIEDEYDVQDVLHTLLSAHFEDVRPEEWTPSYAGKSARTDFLLKREKILVEAKKTRNSLKDKEIIQQLAVDIMQYRNHPDCKALVCLIYDPDRLLQNPSAIEADLSSDQDGLAVRVLVCPKGL